MMGWYVDKNDRLVWLLTFAAKVGIKSKGFGQPVLLSGFIIGDGARY